MTYQETHGLGQETLKVYNQEINNIVLGQSVYVNKRGKISTTLTCKLINDTTKKSKTSPNTPVKVGVEKERYQIMSTQKKPWYKWNYNMDEQKGKVDIRPLSLITQDNKDIGILNLSPPLSVLRGKFPIYFTGPKQWELIFTR